MIPVLAKEPNDSRVFTMDFGALLTAGDYLVEIDSLTALPTGLTLGASAVSATKLQVRLSGGSDGTRYKITAVVQTAADSTLEGEGYLDVRDL